MKSYLLIVPFLLVLFSASAQNDTTRKNKNCKEKAFGLSIGTGALAGAQITTNSVYQKYGGGVYASLRNNLTDRIALGFGAGIEQLDRESLYPFYFEGRGILSDNAASGFLLVQAGYAAASNSGYENYEGYKYRGGGLFSAGWGYRWPLKNDHFVSISTSFRQQFIHLTYSGLNSFKFKERLSYSLVSVRVAMDF